MIDFDLFYKRLKTIGWFEEVKEAIDGHKEIPPMIKDYGNTLISLVKRERKLDKKYEYYLALSTLVDYIAGDLR